MVDYLTQIKLISSTSSAAMKSSLLVVCIQHAWLNELYSLVIMGSLLVDMDRKLAYGWLCNYIIISKA